MSAKPNYFKIGVFTIAAIVIGLLGIVALGAGKLFEKKVTLETYLNESVQGLDIGSQVRYKGVNVGNVTHISFTHRKYKTDRTYVLVEFAVDPEHFGATDAGELAKELEEEVADGFRVRLSSVGITGTLYLEMERIPEDRPGSRPPLELTWTPQHIYVPSTESTIARLSQATEDVFKKLQAIDIAGLTEVLTNTLIKVQKKIDDTDVTRLTDAAIATMATASNALVEVQMTLREAPWKPIIERSTNLLNTLDGVAKQDIPITLQKVQTAVARLELALENNEPTLQEALVDLRASMKNLNEFTENAKRWPAQVFFGDPPPPRKVSR